MDYDGIMLLFMMLNQWVIVGQLWLVLDHGDYLFLNCRFIIIEYIDDAEW